MTDSATGASPGDSTPPDSMTPSNIMERLELHKEENPTAMEYWIETELEAAELLTAMAASLQLLRKDPNPEIANSEVLADYARLYRRTVAQGKAINYLRNLTDSDAISVHGMRIRARRIVLQ